MTLDEVVADEEAGAEASAFAAIESDHLRSSITSMPEKCRKLLTLLYLEEDVPYTEVSERLGMAVGAIGPTRARCLDKLRRQLHESGFFAEHVSDPVRGGS